MRIFWDVYLSMLCFCTSGCQWVLDTASSLHTARSGSRRQKRKSNLVSVYLHLSYHIMQKHCQLCSLIRHVININTAKIGITTIISLCRYCLRSSYCGFHNDATNTLQHISLNTLDNVHSSDLSTYLVSPLFINYTFHCINIILKGCLYCLICI